MSLYRKYLALPRNVRYAALIVLVFCVWILSGQFVASEDIASGLAESAKETSAVSVAAEQFTAQDYVKSVRITGRSEPLAQVNLAAQTSGEVQELLADRGDKVKKGSKLLQIRLASRPSDLAAAEAQVKSTKAKAKTASELFENGYASETRLAEAEADLAVAEQALADIRQDIAYATVTAPIAGLVEDRLVDVGDYVAIGDPLFDLVGRDRFLIVGNAAQQDQARLHTGMEATAKLANGQEVSGNIRFIATNADPQTRTYRVEVLVDGAQYQIPTGMTATLDLPVETIRAYKLPHAMLVLADDGTVGVMRVKRDGEASSAEFVEVETLADTPDGVWLTGLPEEGVELITRGQASVRTGTAVNVNAEKFSAGKEANGES